MDLNTGLLLDGRRNRVLNGQAELTLNHGLFRGDALVFDALKSRSVRLYSTKSGRGVSLDFDGFDYLGIWSPSLDAPFVCLEPWTGMATRASEDDVFEHKLGMTELAPGDERRLPLLSGSFEGAGERDRWAAGKRWFSIWTVR